MPQCPAHPPTPRYHSPPACSHSSSTAAVRSIQQQCTPSRGSKKHSAQRRQRSTRQWGTQSPRRQHKNCQAPRHRDRLRRQRQTVAQRRKGAGKGGAHRLCLRFAHWKIRCEARMRPRRGRGGRRSRVQGHASRKGRAPPLPHHGALAQRAFCICFFKSKAQSNNFAQKCAQGCFCPNAQSAQEHSVLLRAGQNRKKNGDAKS